MVAILKELNPLLKGWANYFALTYHATRALSGIYPYIWRKIER
jgi:Group II intron, maturase-specific domain